MLGGLEGKSDRRDWKDKKKQFYLIGMCVWKSVVFMLKILWILIENHWKSVKNPPGRAPGAPKLRKMVPRVPWTAPRGSPGDPRRAQRGKNGAQETPKNAPWTPTWPHLGPSGAQMGVFRWKWVAFWWKLAQNGSQNREILKNENHWKTLKKQWFSMIFIDF